MIDALNKIRLKLMLVFTGKITFPTLQENTPNPAECPEYTIQWFPSSGYLNGVLLCLAFPRSVLHSHATHSLSVS